MLQSIADELESKTKVYWRISRIFNGRTAETMETGDAIRVVRALQEYSNPSRPINYFAAKLKMDIIRGDILPLDNTTVIYFNAALRHSARG